jgi:tRNA pseudouridine38-40 synthase
LSAVNEPSKGPSEGQNKEREQGVLLTVSYDGTAFRGWARQNGVRTVEETLTGAVLAVDPRAGPLRGASRTDAGVHAAGQLAAFDAGLDAPPRGWVLEINKHLPEDVAVRAACRAPAGFSPRLAARGKRYRYRMLVDRVRDPQWRTRAWRLPELDTDAMLHEAALACGTHDFASFRAAGDARVNTMRTMTRVDVEREEDPRIVAVVIEGDAFLQHMVRILVGTMADVARGRLARGTMATAIRARDRRAAGMTAPAHGLVLERVDVDSEGLGERWPP